MASLIFMILLCQIPTLTITLSHLTILTQMNFLCRPVIINSQDNAFLQIRKQGQNLNNTVVMASGYWKDAEPGTSLSSFPGVEVWGSVQDGFLGLNMTVTNLTTEGKFLAANYQCLYGYRGEHNELHESTLYNISLTTENLESAFSEGEQFKLVVIKKGILQNNWGFKTKEPLVAEFVKELTQNNNHHEGNSTDTPRVVCEKRSGLCLITGLQVSDSVKLNFNCSSASEDSPDKLTCTEQDGSDNKADDEHEEEGDHNTYSFWSIVITTGIICSITGVVITALVCKYYKRCPVIVCSSKPSTTPAKSNAKEEDGNADELKNVTVVSSDSKNDSVPEEPDKNEEENGTEAMASVKRRTFNGVKYCATNKTKEYRGNLNN